MLRLSPFDLHMPNNLSDALSILEQHPNSKICAGGTDLLPNLKHELFSPKHVIHLENVGELKEIAVIPYANGSREAGSAHSTEPSGLADGSGPLGPVRNADPSNNGSFRLRDDRPFLHIGAMTRLADIRDSLDIQTNFPALAKAAGMVAGPQLQQMGTIGGNIALDTRCLYYNQSQFWRESLGYCLKKDGDICHVTGTGKRCVAAASNDTATALIALDASVTIQSVGDEKTIPILDFYNNDGAKNNILQPNEMLTHLHIPLDRDGSASYSAFEKVRYRNSIDFPLVSVASMVTLDFPSPPVGEGRTHEMRTGRGGRLGVTIQGMRICINALAAKPKLFQPKEAIGCNLDELDIPALAANIAKKCHPLKNICGDLAWRKEMIEEAIVTTLDKLNRR